MSAFGVPCGVIGLNTNWDTWETRRCTAGDVCGVARHVLGGRRAGERAGDKRAAPARTRRASYSRCSCRYWLLRCDSRLESSSTWCWLASSCRELPIQVLLRRVYLALQLSRRLLVVSLEVVEAARRPRAIAAPR